MNNVFLGGFSDIASGFFVTASQVPSAQANMILARLQSAVLMVVTIFGVAFLYLIPGIFIVKGLMATVPGLNKISNATNSFGGVGSGGGENIKSFLTSNYADFLIAIIFALNAGTGLWATEMGWFSQGAAAVVQKVANGQWMTANTPASIAQFKSEVKVYSDKQCAALYETYLSKERNMKQSLEQYVSSQHPDSSDMNYVNQKAAYTAVVCRLQILADKLNNDQYASKAGISDTNYFKQHLQADSASSDQDGAFNSAFVQSSMVQAFGTSIPTSSN